MSLSLIKNCNEWGNETKWALAMYFGESNTKAQMTYMFKHLLIIPAIEALTREITERELKEEDNRHGSHT